MLGVTAENEAEPLQIVAQARNAVHFIQECPDYDSVFTAYVAAGIDSCNRSGLLIHSRPTSL